MRRAFAILLPLLVLAAVVPSCGKAGPCTKWVCASNGKNYCWHVPIGMQAMDPVCCPTPPESDVEDTGTHPSDAAVAQGGEDAGTAPHVVDAGAQPRSCDKDAGASLAKFWGLMDAGNRLPPEGHRDDAGLPYHYYCGVELCHLSPWGDGGPPTFDGSSQQCGPLGCQ